MSEQQSWKYCHLDSLVVFWIWLITAQCPAVVSQHTLTPEAVVLFLYNTNVLVKSFTIFICKEIQMGVQEMNF